MPTDVERLLVQLEVSQNKFEKQMARAAGTANRRARQIETRFRKLNATVSRSLGNLAGPLAAAFTIKGAKDLIDASTRIDNALKIAGLSGEELTDVYDQLFASAQRNAAPIEQLVELYSRAALVQKDLGISQAELINFTDKVGVALRVAGKSATQTSGALLQLGQALGSGVVRAEEFNSIQEGALPILSAVAAGLEEAGGSVSKLRTLVIDGQVSSEAFFRAFEAGSVVLDEKVSGAVLTLDQRMTQLKNTFIESADRIDTATSASTFFGTAIEEFATDIQNVVDEIQDLILWVGNLAEAWAVLDFSSLGNLSESAQTAIDIIKSGGQATAQSNFDAKRDRQPGPAAAPAQVTTVSVDDFAPPASGSGGSSGGSSTRALDDFQRQIQLIKERTDALRVEQSVVGASVEVEARAKASQDLLNAARRAGIPLTAELSAQIDQIAGLYAQEVLELENLQAAQERSNEAIQQFGDTSKEIFRGVLDDIKNGADAMDILTNAVDKLATSLSNRVLDGLFSGGIGGGGAGGIIGSIFGFADGGVAKNGRPQQLPRFAGGGVSRNAAIFGEGKLPEAAVPLPDGRRIPVELKMPAAAMSSGTTISMPVTINAQGAQQGVGQEIANQLGTFRKEILQIVSAERKANPAF